ncbi:MAG: GNAT family N-acetyltransferase [Thermotogota bacterium]
MLAIRETQAEDEPFVLSCSHAGESAEIDACSARRGPLLRRLRSGGAVAFAAFLDGEAVGFAHGIPIELSSWGPLGEGILTLPCLYVVKKAARLGAGRRLVEAVLEAARRQRRTAVATTAYRDLPGAEWFLPAAFFESVGFDVVAERGREVLLWRPLLRAASPPRFLESTYQFQPVPGRVAVDLFWNGFCPTSDIEAERVRGVCASYAPRVLLREYCAEDRHALLEHQIPRGIFVDGWEIGWGYEAPEEGIRDAIEAALRGCHPNS